MTDSSGTCDATIVVALAGHQEGHRQRTLCRPDPHGNANVAGVGHAHLDESPYAMLSLACVAPLACTLASGCLALLLRDRHGLDAASFTKQDSKQLWK